MKWIFVFASAYIFICAGMFFMQRKLMYFPEAFTGMPINWGMENTEEVFQDTQDGQKILLWHKPAESGKPTLIFFHGNAGHLGYRVETFTGLTQTGLGLIALSYRGYGKSTGTPSEQGLYADARAAIAYAKTQNIAPENTILFGESLGSGVAVQMATEFPTRMLVLQAPYTSIANRAKEIYPFLPTRHLTRDQFDSINKIGTVKTPVLIFHGAQDDVIPISHGRAMLKAANDPKKAEFLPEVDHVNFPLTRQLETIERFLAETQSSDK